MTFRRVLAAFFIFLFIVVSLPAFLFFGISNSFLRSSFYQGQVVDVSYDYLLNATAKKILEKDDVIAAYFNETDLKSEMTTVFPVSLFRGISDSLASQVEGLKDNLDKPLTISLKVFRESLLTFANNLSFKLFQKLPVCAGGQVPDLGLNGIPTCVPVGVQYNQIAAPLAQRFESAVYSAIPEQLQIDLNVPLGQSGISLAAIVKWFMYSKYIFYGLMLFLLAMIALLVYAPFSLIVKYEGIAFIFSGIVGYVMSLGISYMPDLIYADMNIDKGGGELRQLLQYLASYMSAESQKIALIFLALGALLMLVTVFLKRSYRSEKAE
jgi:hypothetical protein